MDGGEAGEAVLQEDASGSADGSGAEEDERGATAKRGGGSGLGRKRPASEQFLDGF